MSEVYYIRPHFSQLSKDWNEFVKDNYKILFPNFPDTDYSPRLEPWNWIRGSFLRYISLNRLMSELDNDLYQLILWEERLVSLIDRVEIGHDSVEIV